MEALIEFIARALVEQPEEVEVRRLEGPALELRVDEDDLGKVIGRKGRTAKAMRTLLRAACEGDRPLELEIAAHGAEREAE